MDPFEPDALEQKSIKTTVSIMKTLVVVLFAVYVILIV